MIDFNEALDVVLLKQEAITPETALQAYQAAVDELQELYPDAPSSDCHDCIQAEVPRLWKLAMQASGRQYG